EWRLAGCSRTRCKIGLIADGHRVETVVFRVVGDPCRPVVIVLREQVPTVGCAVARLPPCRSAPARPDDSGAQGLHGVPTTGDTSMTAGLGFRPFSHSNA